METKFIKNLPFIRISCEKEDVNFLIDTGFDGQLFVPYKIIRKMNARLIGMGEYIQPDGSKIVTGQFYSKITWLGKQRIAIFEGADINLPLCGMDLLKSAKMVIDPSNNILTIGKAK